MSDGGQEDQEEREQETNAVQTPATIVVGGADKGALRLVLAAVPSYDGTGDPHEWVHKALRKVGAFCTEAVCWQSPTIHSDGGDLLGLGGSQRLSPPFNPNNHAQSSTTNHTGRGAG